MQTVIAQAHLFIPVGIALSALAFLEGIQRKYLAQLLYCDRCEQQQAASDRPRCKRCRKPIQLPEADLPPDSDSEGR